MMYDNWSRNQKMRWFWGWTIVTGLFLLFAIIMFFVVTRILHLQDKHIETVIGMGISLPLAGVIGYQLHNKWLLCIFPDNSPSD